MPRILLVVIPDPEGDDIPEQPDELSNTLFRFFGDHTIGAHVYYPTLELEREIVHKVAGGQAHRVTERLF